MQFTGVGPDLVANGLTLKNFVDELQHFSYLLVNIEQYRVNCHVQKIAYRTRHRSSAASSLGPNAINLLFILDDLNLPSPWVRHPRDRKHVLPTFSLGTVDSSVLDLSQRCEHVSNYHVKIMIIE